MFLLQIHLSIFYMLLHSSGSVEEQSWIKIPCRANIEQGLKYRRITWYKVEGDPDALTGLVLKDFLKNITTLFKYAKHSYQVGEDNALLIPGAAEEDCGIYRCTLWPPLGHSIQEGIYAYDSADCIKPQPQVESSKKNSLPANHPFTFVITICVLIVCAVVIMLLKGMGKDAVKKKLVQIDGRL